MSSESQWFYSDAQKKQQGPLSFAQLQQLAAVGQIQPDSLVWNESMPNWTPAAEVSGLLPEGAAPSAPASQSTNPYATPATSTAPQAVSGGSYPIPFVKRCSIPLYLFTYIGGFVLLIAGVIFLMATSNEVVVNDFDSTYTTDEDFERLERQIEESEDVSTGGLVVLLGGLVVFVIGAIFGFIFLYRAWFILQPGGARTTPGKAVGFMFIPFFNFYWKFVAFHGWSQDWNRIRAAHDNLQPVPPVAEGLFLAGAICFVAGIIPAIGTLIGLVAFVLDIIMTVKMAQVVNQLATAQRS